MIFTGLGENGIFYDFGPLCNDCRDLIFIVFIGVTLINKII